MSIYLLLLHSPICVRSGQKPKDNILTTRHIIQVVHEEPKPQEVEPEPTQKEKDRQAQEVVKEVLKAIKLAQAEADREKAEAQKRASSVTVRYVLKKNLIAR